MYNLLSDKLDRFEREVRKLRNTIVAKLLTWQNLFGFYTFSKFKPYIHTEHLKRFRDAIKVMDGEIEKELELRKKISQHNKDVDLLIRDSSVLNQDTLRMINLKNNSAQFKCVGISGKVAARINQDENSNLLKTSSSAYKRVVKRPNSKSSVLD